MYDKLRTYTRGKAHLHRPDWYDMIAAAARTTLVAALVDARARTGAAPLVVDRDTILYLSNDPDPRSAWPGNPDKLDSIQGGWRPTGTTRLVDWGPTALADHAGAWEHTTHMTAMAPSGPAVKQVSGNEQPARRYASAASAQAPNLPRPRACRP